VGSWKRCSLTIGFARHHAKVNRSIHERRGSEVKDWNALGLEVAAGMDYVKVVANGSGKVVAPDDRLVFVDHARLPD
jgi:hypothetical protein